MTKELLIKYLENRCSPKEMELVVQWIENEALSVDGEKIVFDDWKSLGDDTTENIDDRQFGLLLDKIHHKININDSGNIKNKPRRTVSMIVTWLTRAAAILLIPVLGFLIYLLPETSYYSPRFSNVVVDSLEIIAPVGSRTVVQLSDGTVVHLNYGSKIKYPRTFGRRTRGLTLSGEAYFDVFHDPERPFMVQTGRLNVVALGTRFDVEAYSGEDNVAVTLVRGKVALDVPDRSGNIERIKEMKPNQHVDFNLNTGKTSTTQGQIHKYIAWKDGLLVFENANILEVAEKLNRMFNVNIEVADEIRDYTYTVTFLDEPLSQMLELFTKATPISYTIFPRKKLPDGTFSKQRILLSAKKNNR